VEGSGGHDMGLNQPGSNAGLFELRTSARLVCARLLRQWPENQLLASILKKSVPWYFTLENSRGLYKTQDIEDFIKLKIKRTFEN
jgi:hypothetical protein